MPNYKKYIGKTVLVGISVFSYDDELLDSARAQNHLCKQSFLYAQWTGNG